MSTYGSKVKVFFSTALCLSSAGFAFYAAAHMFARDGSDYFISGHPLPMLAHALSIASILWFFCAFLLIPAKALPTDDFMRNTPCSAAIAPAIGSLLAGTVTITYLQPDALITALQNGRGLDANALCTLLVLLGTLPAAAYFILRIFNASKIANLTVILGAGPVMVFTGLCGLTYFELDHHMNAPAKVGIQLAWIATMIYLTAELRCSLDKAQPRRYLTSACIALFANACAISCVLPVLLKTTENLHGTRMLAFSALCLGCLIYIAYRLAAFTAFCNQPPKEDPVEAQADGETPTEDPETPSQESPVETTQEISDPITDTNTDPEQTQGKDDQQDGSQQQDPMAS